MSKRFERLCKRLKIEGLVYHDLRHTFATRLNEADVPLPTIMRILGHTNVRTAMRYQSTRAAEMLRAVDRLE